MRYGNDQIWKVALGYVDKGCNEHFRQ